MLCMECGSRGGHRPGCYMLKEYSGIYPPEIEEPTKTFPGGFSRTYYPSYRKYKCGDCGGEFDNPVVRTLKDKDDGKTICPFCGD